MSDNKPVSVVPFGCKVRLGIVKGGCGDARCGDCYERAGDFSDLESQRVFDAAAGVVARELGRQAAREWFEETRKKP